MADPDCRISELEFVTPKRKLETSMKLVERKQSNLERLLRADPKRVNVTASQMVRTTTLKAGEKLPLVIEPVRPDVNLVEWGKGHRHYIDEKLSQHGGVLLRGFAVPGVKEFEEFGQGQCGGLYGEYGDLPREAVSEKIYSATPYPADQEIKFHNEGTHTGRWPLRILFHCLKPAEQGGETPVADCRKLYEQIDRRIIQQFKDKGIMYVRNFEVSHSYFDGLDVSWQEFFRTSEKSEVERRCKELGMDCEWKASGGLRIKQVCPAVAPHPRTGEMVFFNQLQVHHISCMSPVYREPVKRLFKEEDLPRNAYFGDGTQIEDRVMEEISDVYSRNAVSFPWQTGDILLIDNMLAAHMRNRYAGPRKIVVAMGDMIKKTEVQQ